MDFDPNPPAPPEPPPFGVAPTPFETPVPTRPAGPRGHTLIGWTVIILMIVVMIASNKLQSLAVEESPNPEDPVGVMIMEIQGRYMAFAADFSGGDGRLVYAQSASQLNQGSVGQRGRWPRSGSRR